MNPCALCSFNCESLIVLLKRILQPVISNVRCSHPTWRSNPFISIPSIHGAVSVFEVLLALQGALNLVIHPIQSNHPRCSIHPSCHLEPVSNGTGNYGHYYGQQVARRMKEQAWSNHAKMIDCIFLYLLNLLLCRQPRGAIIVAARSTDCLISSASGSLTSKRSNGRKICIQLQAVNVLLMNKLGRRLASFGIKRW